MKIQHIGPRLSAIASALELVVCAGSTVAFIVLGAVWSVCTVLNHGNPDWIGLAAVIAILSLYMIPMFHGFMQEMIHAKRHEEGRCPACGYDLRASRDRCPECGAPMIRNPQSAIRNPQ